MSLSITAASNYPISVVEADVVESIQRVLEVMNSVAQPAVGIQKVSAHYKRKSPVSIPSNISAHGKDVLFTNFPRMNMQVSSSVSRSDHAVANTSRTLLVDFLYNMTYGARQTLHLGGSIVEAYRYLQEDTSRTPKYVFRTPTQLTKDLARNFEHDRAMEKADLNAGLQMQRFKRKYLLNDLKTHSNGFFDWGCSHNVGRTSPVPSIVDLMWEHGIDHWVGSEMLHPTMLWQSQGRFDELEMNFIIDAARNLLVIYPDGRVSTAYPHNWQEMRLFLLPVAHYTRFGSVYEFRVMEYKLGHVVYSIHKVPGKSQVPRLFYGSATEYMRVKAAVPVRSTSYAGIEVDPVIFHVEKTMHSRIMASLRANKDGRQLGVISTVVANFNSAYVVNGHNIGTKHKLAEKYVFAYVLALYVHLMELPDLETHLDMVTEFIEKETTVRSWSFFDYVADWWNDSVRDFEKWLKKQLRGDVQMFSITEFEYGVSADDDLEQLGAYERLARDVLDFDPVDLVSEVTTFALSVFSYPLKDVTPWFKKLEAQPGVVRLPEEDLFGMDTLWDYLDDINKKPDRKSCPDLSCGPYDYDDNQSEFSEYDDCLEEIVPVPDLCGADEKTTSEVTSVLVEEVFASALAIQTSLVEVHEAGLMVLSRNEPSLAPIPVTDGSNIFSLEFVNGLCDVTVVDNLKNISPKARNIVTKTVFQKDPQKVNIRCVTHGVHAGDRLLTIDKVIQDRNVAAVGKVRLCISKSDHTGVVTFTEATASWNFEVWVRIYKFFFKDEWRKVRLEAAKRIYGTLGMAGMGKTYSIVSDMFDSQRKTGDLTKIPPVLASSNGGVAAIATTGVRRGLFTEVEGDVARTIDLFILKCFNSLERGDLRPPEAFKNINFDSYMFFVDEALMEQPAKIIILGLLWIFYSRVQTTEPERPFRLNISGDFFQSLTFEYFLEGIPEDKVSRRFWQSIPRAAYNFTSRRQSIDAMHLLSKLYSSNPSYTQFKDVVCKTYKTSLCSFGRCCLINGEQDVIWAPNVDYLAFDPPEMQSLQAYFDRHGHKTKVRTVDEYFQGRASTVRMAQGVSDPTICLVRTRLGLDTPRNQLNLALFLVAVSRHSSSFFYMTVQAGDKLWQTVETTIDETTSAGFDYRKYMVDPELQLEQRTPPLNLYVRR